jgi:DNA-directed RNA polymerase specialized sigma24 family protein
MTIFKRKRVANSEAGDYASAEDFRRVFSEERDKLHLLSLLLTGDHETAEQCLVAGLEDSVSTNGVFKDWARNWAKRTIIQQAISVLKPRRPQHAMSSTPEHAAEIGSSMPNIADRDLVRSSVLALEDFERFVFVMTVLEGYSEHQCALLLYATLQDVRDARIRATEHIVRAESSPMLLPVELDSSTSRACT